MPCVLCIFLIYSNIYIDSINVVSKFVEIGGILPYVEAIKSNKFTSQKKYQISLKKFTNQMKDNVAATCQTLHMGEV